MRYLQLRIAVALIGTVVLGIALAACGGGHDAARTAPRAGDPTTINWQFPNKEIPGVRQREVGHGARGATVLSRRAGPPSRDVVIFFHGWEPVPPYFYGAWIRHLAFQGYTVIYPAYRELPSTKPAAYYPNALAGVRAALETLPSDPRRVVAIGITTGGVLAFDYAASATSRGLPMPAAVLAFYPGRRPPGGVIPLTGLGRIRPRTDLEAISGPGNSLPDGDSEARLLLAAAHSVPRARRRYVRIPADATPSGVVGLAKPNVFWTRAQKLIDGSG